MTFEVILCFKARLKEVGTRHLIPVSYEPLDLRLSYCAYML